MEYQSHNYEIEKDEISLIEVFKKILNGRKIILKWIGIFFIFGIVIIIINPKEYKSEATLLIETGSSTSGMSNIMQQFSGLAGINLGNNAEDALTPELYPDIIKSTPFLLEVMDMKVKGNYTDSALKVTDYLLYHTKSGVGSIVIGYTFGLPGKIIGMFKGKSIETNGNVAIEKNKPLKLTDQQSRVLSMLSSRILAKDGKSSGTLDISVEMQDPVIAAQLVDSIIACLTGYIIEYRTQKENYDLKFVEARHSEAEAKYLKAQRNLAAYKDRNRNVILASAQTSEQNLQAEYNLAFSLYNALSQRLEEAKMKVQEKTPVFKVFEPAKVALGKSKPKTGLILFGMAFLGALLGIGNIFGQFLFSQIKMGHK